MGKTFSFSKFVLQSPLKSMPKKNYLADEDAKNIGL